MKEKERACYSLFLFIADGLIMFGSAIHDGLSLRDPALLGWVAALAVNYFALRSLLVAKGMFATKIKKSGTVGYDLVSYLVVSFCFTGYCAVVGTQMFFGAQGEALQKGGFYAPSDEVKYQLVVPMLAYQFANFLICAKLKEYRTASFIGHHLVTAALAYFATAPYLLYYGLFFFGVAEISSVPLNIVDLFKSFPELGEAHPSTNAFFRYVFVLSFFSIRVVAWPIVSYSFWMGSIELLRAGTSHSDFVVVFFLLANIFLTGLQFFWAYLISRQLYKMIFGKKQPKKKST